MIIPPRPYSMRHQHGSWLMYGYLLLALMSLVPLLWEAGSGLFGYADFDCAIHAPRGVKCPSAKYYISHGYPVNGNWP